MSGFYLDNNDFSRNLHKIYKNERSIDIYEN